MAEADWVFLTGGLTISEVDRGPTSGIDKPSGGGNFVFGFNSLQIVNGAVALHNSQASFVPMAKGGSVRGAVKRGLGGGNTGFAPMLFIGLQGPDVTDSAYILGLSDGEPYRIALRKGALNAGLPDEIVDPDGGSNILMRSTETFNPDKWVHLRLDMIVQGTGDVLLQVFRNDLTLDPVTSPDWKQVPGMEGPQSPGIEGFVDDALGVNTGSAPHTSGRAGFGFHVQDVTRRSYFDHIEVARQL